MIYLAPFKICNILVNTQPHKKTTCANGQTYRYLCHCHFLKHQVKFSVNLCARMSGSYLKQDLISLFLQH